MPEVAREDLLQQDRQRPAVDDDVVEGQHEPVLVPLGANQRRAQRRSIGKVADRGTLGGAEPLNLFVGSQIVPTKVEVSPCDDRIGKNHLYRISVLSAEPGRQVGVTAHH